MTPPHAPAQAATPEAVLDSAHSGDIEGALGTIRRGDTRRRSTWRARFITLLAIAGPGLIVMAGQNEAGAFSTYAQAGQNYGYGLLWTLIVLIPVLYINQEMVVRLGAVTGVGHARLILERFGRFWGMFSVIDLFVLNALTIVTEFIGINLGLRYLGFPQIAGVLVSALVIMFAVSTGNFRRFERFSLFLVGGSFIILPMYLIVHPPLAEVVHHTLVPSMPKGAEPSGVMLMVIAIVGTTIAPWQLFFQQSYVIDKRITPRFIKYERIDLIAGIVLVILGAIAIIACTAFAFSKHPQAGHFTDVAAVATGLAQYCGRNAGTLFALGLIDSCIIGASAVSLSTSYALADVLSVKHSLHRKPSDAKGFYGVYFVLIVLAAILVLAPHMPLGLLTSAVQTLAGVLLPSATVFLLLLCNDTAVLGPWVNGPKVNAFTSLVVAVLLLLSIILTISVLFPGLTRRAFELIALGGTALCAGGALIAGIYLRRAEDAAVPEYVSTSAMETWRMPPLGGLEPRTLSRMHRLWMAVLRGYMILAAGLVLVHIVSLALGAHRSG